MWSNQNPSGIILKSNLSSSIQIGNTETSILAQVLALLVYTQEKHMLRYKICAQNIHSKQPKCPSTLEWVNTLACSYNGIYIMKMNETHYIQQCKYISKYWLKEIRLERGYKMGFCDTANDLFCLPGRGCTRIQFVTGSLRCTHQWCTISVCMLYIFNFTHKKWKKMKTSTFDQDSYKNQIYPSTSNNNKHKQNTWNKGSQENKDHQKWKLH